MLVIVVYMICELVNDSVMLCCKQPHSITCRRLVSALKLPTLIQHVGTRTVVLTVGISEVVVTCQCFKNVCELL